MFFPRLFVFHHHGVVSEILFASSHLFFFFFFCCLQVLEELIGYSPAALKATMREDRAVGQQVSRTAVDYFIRPPIGAPFFCEPSLCCIPRLWTEEMQSSLFFLVPYCVIGRHLGFSPFFFFFLPLSFSFFRG